MNALAAPWSHWFEPPTPLALALGSTALVFAAGLLAYKVIFRLLSRLAGWTTTKLDDVLVRRLRPAALLLVGLVAVDLFAQLRANEPPWLHKLAITLELLLATYLVVETVETFVIFYWLEERKKVHVPAVVRHVALVAIYLVAVLSIVGTVTGVNVLPIVATSTVLTVVLGLALQDTLGNLLTGLALHVERPFSLGDWVLIDGVEGRVVYMGWRSTHLHTFSDDIVVFPNSAVSRARIQNFYAPDRRTSRSVDVPVDPAATPEAVEAAARRACARVERVLADPPPKLWLRDLTPLFHRYVLKFWVADFRHHDESESDVMKALVTELRADGLALDPARALPGVDAAGATALVAAPRPRPPAP